MDRKVRPGVDTNDEKVVPDILDPLDEPTQTIDLSVLASPGTAVDTAVGEKSSSGSLLQLLQAIPVPTLLIARSHAVKFANAAFKKMARAGFSSKGATFASLFPNPREARQAQLLLEKVFKDRAPEVRESILQIRHSRIWGRMHLRSIRFGSGHFVLVQIENLTAQKQLLAIQKYRKLVKIFPIGIVELALRKQLDCSLPPSVLLNGILDAYITDGNNEFAAMYKRTEIKELVGVRLGALFPFKGKSKQWYENWIRHQFPASSFETKETIRSDNIHFFENTLIGNVNKDRLLGIWWLKRDISDKKRTEEEMVKNQKLESLGILAGGIAHDFNNLLTGILGNVSLARTFIEPDHRAVSRLDAAAKASTRAQELTRQLLTFSRGGAPLKKTASISELLKDAVTFAVRGSHVASQFDISENLWPIDMDEGQISQVVNNLIINAIQAMPLGGTIRIRAANAIVDSTHNLPLRQGNYVTVSISDNGIGIPLEHQQKIFDPYFTTKNTGSGLGLATSYSIIRKHDGFIGVNSEAGKGTTFTFYLPASVKSPEPQRRTYQDPDVSRGRILVMDDEELIRDLVGEMLTVLGYVAEYAKDGAEAIEKYGQAFHSDHPYDLVLMDLTIPGGLGGREAVQRLRQIDPAVKAVVSSGYSNDTVMADFEEFGFLGVLPKPYNLEEVRRLLNRMLGNSEDKLEYEP
ncbi:MAG TPA: ATP-binding protein [Desulfomonilaceae bacterium]|nr:ATP-binding protein [Desulfomonilaceae bacterium]